MTVATRSKPVPAPDAASTPFFSGALRGELMLLRCGVCGTYQSPTAYLGVPLRPRCVRCFAAALEWAPASGRATLYSYALMHKVYDEAFAADVPYNIAVVETEEGVRLTSQVVECDALEIGMALEVTFERVGEDVAIPKFRPRR
jgi:uncharacterized OB-fold protein